MHSNKTVTTNGKAAHDGPPEVGMLTKSRNTIYIVLQGNILESFGIYFFLHLFLIYLVPQCLLIFSFVYLFKPCDNLSKQKFGLTKKLTEIHYYYTVECISQ